MPEIKNVADAIRFLCMYQDFDFAIVARSLMRILRESDNLSEISLGYGS